MEAIGCTGLRPVLGCPVLVLSAEPDFFDLNFMPSPYASNGAHTSCRLPRTRVHTACVAGWTLEYALNLRIGVIEAEVKEIGIHEDQRVRELGSAAIVAAGPPRGGGGPVWAGIGRTFCYGPDMPPTRVLTATSSAKWAALARKPRAGMRMAVAGFRREFLAWWDWSRGPSWKNEPNQPRRASRSYRFRTP